MDWNHLPSLLTNRSGLKPLTIATKLLTNRNELKPLTITTNKSIWKSDDVHVVMCMDMPLGWRRTVFRVLSWWMAAAARLWSAGVSHSWWRLWPIRCLLLHLGNLLQFVDLVSLALVREEGWRLRWRQYVARLDIGWRHCKRRRQHLRVDVRSRGISHHSGV